MSLQEASYFHNSYSDLFQELREMELSEKVDNPDTAEEFLTCLRNLESL